MKELVTVIRAALDLAVPGVRDVFIAVDDQVLPAGTKLPCIGIKDGPVTTRALTCGVVEDTMQVRIICWAPHGKGPAQVIGDSTHVGVLGMSDYIQGDLAGNLLGITGMQSAEVTAVSESRMFINERKKTVQQLIITMEYVRER